MSNESERKMAKEIGAEPTKNSGRGMYKGDMRLDNFLIDLKEVSKSFQLDLSVWAKICTDAATYGYDTKPLLLIKFPNGVRLAVTDFYDLVENQDNG